jgi:glutaredoxin
MMRFALTLLLALQLWAGMEQMPALFAQMGDPLYAFAQNAQSIKDDTVLGHEVSSYAAEADAVRKTGLAAENEKSGEARAVYLHQLRGLKKASDHLMLGMKRELLESIRTNNVGRFMQLVSTEPSVASEDHTLRQEISEFYTAKGLKGQSAFLDSVVQKERALETAYAAPSPDSGGTYMEKSAYGGTFRERSDPGGTHTDKQVILIGTATCPHCRNARKFLREQGIAFQDLDVKSAQGRQLYKQNNGHGVPLILIGESRISGFSPQAILRAYGK